MPTAAAWRSAATRGWLTKNGFPTFLCGCATPHRPLALTGGKRSWLRTDRGHQGPAGCARRSRAKTVLKPMSKPAASTRRIPAFAIKRRGDQRDRMRFHRRLRRLPRNLAEELPARRSSSTSACIFGWLGVLSETRPVSDELIYVSHDAASPCAACARHAQPLLRAVARSPRTSEQWPRRAFWDELRSRLDVTPRRRWSPPSIEKSIAPLRSFVASRCASAAVLGEMRRTSSRYRGERPEPSGERRSLPLDGPDRVLCFGQFRRAERLFRARPAARVAGRTLLVVDDQPAAPLPGARTSAKKSRPPSSSTRGLARRDDALAENYVGLPY